MVGFPHRGWRLTLLLVCSVAGLPAQIPLTLQQAGERNPAADYKPVHADRKVVLRGVVNAHSYHFPEYSMLAIEDGQYGAVLKVAYPDQRLDAYRPGDEIEVSGTLTVFAGMPVVTPDSIGKVAQKAAPRPIEVPMAELNGFRYLGRLVRTEGTIRNLGDTANGAYATMDLPDRFLAFIPRSPAQTAKLTGFAVGQRVQMTGIAYQYCSRPPFNRYFQVLVADPADLIPVTSAWFPSETALGSSLALVLLVGIYLWSRERRVRKQRERLRKTYQLGEEILSSPSAESILKRLSEMLPEVLKVTRVEIFLHNRAAKSLDSVAAEGEPQVSLPLLLPAGEQPSGAVACFEFRSALPVPDAADSPFVSSVDGQGRAPKSLLFVPMLAQTEAVGVLKLGRHDRVRHFKHDDQELAQHLANQAAVAIRLFEQRTVQERLFRTEKLAAVGRLISEVVNELRAPLASISGLAQRTLEGALPVSAEREVAAIALESRKAGEIVDRLVSYAASEQAEAKPVAIGALLRTLIEFREADWKASGIRVRDLTTREPLLVLGSQGQLEQVFLNLLVHAEQALADAPQKVITVRTSVLGKRLLIEIAFTAPSLARKQMETAAVIGVTRSVVTGHGGEVRLIEKSNSDPRFEVELPVSAKERPAAGAAAAAGANGHSPASPLHLTVLVVEPDEATQRQLVGQLSARGARVVPVDDADKGLELAHRIRFDLAFCSVHAPGLNWVELSERMQPRVGAFVLITDRYDPELAADFEGPARHVLARPVQEEELERIVRRSQPSAESLQNGAA
jgi:GAF domain-containing protein/CheY-like chemotaxis protein